MWPWSAPAARWKWRRRHASSLSRPHAVHQREDGVLFADVPRQVRHRRRGALARLGNDRGCQIHPAENLLFERVQGRTAEYGGGRQLQIERAGETTNEFEREQRIEAHRAERTVRIEPCR